LLVVILHIHREKAMATSAAPAQGAERTPLTRNEQLLKYFVQSCPKRLGRTQLVKLVYLTDYEARRYLGNPISSFQWKREPQGPFDEEFYTAKQGLVDKGEIRELEGLTPFGHAWYQYVDAGNPLNPDFTAAERRILRYIVEAYGEKSREEILVDVYATSPFKTVEDSPRGTPLPMDQVNNEKTMELGGLSLAAIIGGEQRIRAGEGIPLSHVLKLLRGTTSRATTA
jgi:hypothetical protein